MWKTAGSLRNLRAANAAKRYEAEENRHMYDGRTDYEFLEDEANMTDEHEVDYMRYSADLESEANSRKDTCQRECEERMVGSEVMFRLPHEGNSVYGSGIAQSPSTVLSRSFRPGVDVSAPASMIRQTLKMLQHQSFVPTAEAVGIKPLKFEGSESTVSEAVRGPLERDQSFGA